MAQANLTDDQVEQVSTLVELLAKARSRRIPAEEAATTLKKMAAVAHDLHSSLAAAGQTPRHHQYMVENRGMNPDDEGFYAHVHPVEDLLKWVADTDANRDPEDVTVGDEFTMKITSRRWGGTDTYHVKRTSTGWEIRNVAIGGASNKAGQPALEANFRQDSIEHPRGLGGWMEWLWERAHEDGLTHEQVQDALDELAEWISLIETKKPKGGVWTGYTT